MTLHYITLHTVYTYIHIQTHKTIYEIYIYIYLKTQRDRYIMHKHTHMSIYTRVFILCVYLLYYICTAVCVYNTYI